MPTKRPGDRPGGRAPANRPVSGRRNGQGAAPHGRVPRSPEERRRAMFRRRRITFAVLALIVVAVIFFVTRMVGWAGGTSDGGGDAKPSDSVAATHDASDICPDSSLQVAGTTDASHYAAGVDPVFTMSITNVGSYDCTVDVGTGQQKWVVKSGSRVYWQSTDCTATPQAQDSFWSYPVVLSAGASRSTTYTWKREISDSTNCSGTWKAAPSGGVAYWLTVQLGNVASANNGVQFFLD